jgi:3-deoxy-D-manno-octulosonate 8-phosphate phosphatase (KDO 8-P phosphatase)
MAYEKIKIIILDCDGVLSDGQIVYDGKQVESKSFSARDGLGISLLRFSDIRVAVVTGRRSEILQQRCADLKIEILHQKVRDKQQKVEEILAAENLQWENVAYMGDDWNDYPALKMAKLSACPNNVEPDFKSKCQFVAEADGGKGAVRQLITYILKSQGIYDKVIANFLANLRS